MYSALAGGFLTTAPPGKSFCFNFLNYIVDDVDVYCSSFGVMLFFS